MASLRRSNLSRAALNKSPESCTVQSSISLEKSIPSYPTKYLDEKIWEKALTWQKPYILLFHGAKRNESSFFYDSSVNVLKFSFALGVTRILSLEIRFRLGFGKTY